MKTKLLSKFQIKHFLIALCMLVSFTGFSQEEESDDSSSNWSLGLDVQSRYIWRGISLGGNGASLQPAIEYSSGMFAIGAWGAYSVGSDQTGQEADLYISISPLDFLSFTVTDYFFPADNVGNNNYFDYSDTTGHVYEAMLSFSGTENFPIGITLATNFGGADKDADGDQSFSTYLEASYGTSVGNVDFSLFAGAVFGDNGGYYGTDGSGFINLGIGASKEVKITDSFSLPVNAALIFNPDQENIFITFGFSL